MNWIQAMMKSSDWNDKYLDWIVEYGSSIDEQKSRGLHLNMVEAGEMALTTLGISYRGSRVRRELRFSHSGKFPSVYFAGGVTAPYSKLIDVILKQSGDAVFIWNHERVSL
jgi:hypothetical protein